ncbi:MAG: class I SAM-dependent methyltransferase [Bacteroidota bacterium]
MTQIYEKNLWGDNQSAFFSGVGSHDSEIVKPYLEAVILFLQSFNEPLSVCDLGCGDFNVGKELVKHTKKYWAIDIVQELIDYNKEKFKEDKLEFMCLDISIDNLPKADCIILRQVLQHLSNNEILCILNKLKDYKYLILTEHLPSGEFTANKDIISGQGIRLKKQSGVKLTSAPFNLKVKEEKELLTFTLKDGKSRIITSLFEIY